MMATCKECLHYEACVLNEAYWVKHNANQACSVFKDKSKYVEQKHGCWEGHPHSYGFVRCSACHGCNIWGEWADGEKWNYCPNCGAKMDKEKEA